MDYKTKEKGYLTKQKDSYRQPEIVVNSPDFERVRKNLPKRLKMIEEETDILNNGMKVSQKTMEKRIDF